MLERIYPEVTTKRVVRLEDEAKRATMEYRARTIVLGLLTRLCVPLAIVGVAGALFHAVKQQSLEIGIRLALGAEASHIRRRIVGHALACVGAGLGVGLAGGLGAGRLMSGYLFGIAAADPLSLIAAAFALVSVAWLSALWPAHRASTIDPSVVLRDC